MRAMGEYVSGIEFEALLAERFPGRALHPQGAVALRLFHEQLHSKHRRSKRTAIDLLVEHKWISCAGECLCLSSVRKGRVTGGYEAWVHTRHAQLDRFVSDLLSMPLRVALLDSAERYHGEMDLDGAMTPFVSGLRFVEDWLFAGVEARFSAKFERAVLNHRATKDAPWR